MQLGIRAQFLLTECRQKCRPRDGVSEYADELTTLGMLFISYKDAVREGDGLNLWKHQYFVSRDAKTIRALYQYYNVLE